MVEPCDRDVVFGVVQCFSAIWERFGGVELAGVDGDGMVEAIRSVRLEGDDRDWFFFFSFWFFLCWIVLLTVIPSDVLASNDDTS